MQHKNNWNFSVLKVIIIKIKLNQLMSNRIYLTYTNSISKQSIFLINMNIKIIKLKIKLLITIIYLNLILIEIYSNIIIQGNNIK